MPNTISNSDDLIDSRDVIARIEELTAYSQHIALSQEESEELVALQTLADEASEYAANWQYGEMLIRDSYFKERAQELAENIGAINADATWPNNCIDWDEAVRRLKQDYTSVTFDGVEYWIR